MTGPQFFEGAVIREDRDKLVGAIVVEVGAEFDVNDLREVVERKNNVERFARYRARIDEVTDTHIIYTVLRRLR